MCTIVVLNQLREDYPVVLATNRDEFYARPTEAALRLQADPIAVGGRDLTAGGTWMGVTETGFFVGVTNQRTFRPPRKDARSRGELVMEALGCAESGGVRELLASLDGRDFNSFNLMFGDASSMWVAYGRAEQRELQVEPLPPGLHVLPNDTLDSAEFAKCARAQALVEPVVTAPWPQLNAGLQAMLADGQANGEVRVPEGADPFFSEPWLRKLTALCVRTPIYGTRSSTVVALAEGDVGHYLYADGAPDEAGFEDVRSLFGAG